MNQSTLKGIVPPSHQRIKQTEEYHVWVKYTFKKKEKLIVASLFMPTIHSKTDKTL